MNPLTNAKIVGENVDPLKYHESDFLRGQQKLVMSASQLKAFLDCPKEWHDGAEQEDTKSTDFGNLIDCLFLSPDQIQDRFFVTPQTYPDAKTGEPKAWTRKANYCKDYEAENGAGKQIVKMDDYYLAEKALRVLRDSNPKIFQVAAHSSHQVHVTADYKDPTTGLVVPLKMLIDMVPRTSTTFNSILVDLKTCRSVHPRAFKSHVHEYGYALSAALYLDGYNAATGEDRNDFRFIIQRNSEPFTTGLRMLSKEWIDCGRRQYQEALAEYAQCLETDTWPSHEDRAASRGQLVIDGFMEVGPEPYMIGGW